VDAAIDSSGTGMPTWAVPPLGPAAHLRRVVGGRCEKENVVDLVIVL